MPKETVGKRDVSRLPGSLSNLSVGMSNAPRVVVPPVVLASHSKEWVAQNLQELRAAGDSLMALVKDSKLLVAEAFEKVGMEASLDGTGRFPPRSE